MDLDLVGYLFDLLDPEERARTEAALQADPTARADLACMRAHLAPLAAARVDEPPPPGLVDRTLALVATKGGANLSPPKNSDIRPAQLPSRGGDCEPVFAPSRWSRFDVAIAASILILVGGLGASGVGELQKQRARATCANNMRQIHQAFATYSLENRGRFPQITDRPPMNVAGAFVPILRDAGDLPVTGMPACPVADIAAGVPNAGGYGYSLGFRRPDGTLDGLHRTDSDLQPILADRAFPISHGNGHNVLFVGGNVRFATTPNVGLGGDHIFINHLGKVLAGRNDADAVLGDANDSP